MSQIAKNASESKNVSFFLALFKLGFWWFLIVLKVLGPEVERLILAISVDCCAQVRTSSTAKAWICVKLPASDLSFGAALDFPSAKFWICLSLDPHSLAAATASPREVVCALLHNEKEI